MAEVLLEASYSTVWWRTIPCTDSYNLLYILQSSIFPEVDFIERANTCLVQRQDLLGLILLLL